MNFWAILAKCRFALLFCCATQCYAATLEIHVIGVNSQAVENAVVYLDHFAQDDASHTPPAIMDQQDKNFIPHLMVVPLGTRVDFSNTDSVNHYVYSFSEAKKFQFKLFKDEKNPPSIVFDQLGLITLGCNIHDFMLGYILVVPNRFFGITNKQGITQISLPDNTHSRIQIWLERANEDLTAVSQPISIQTSDLSIQLKLRKPLKAERRLLHNNNDY